MPYNKNSRNLLFQYILFVDRRRRTWKNKEKQRKIGLVWVSVHFCRDVDLLRVETMIGRIFADYISEGFFKLSLLQAFPVVRPCYAVVFVFRPSVRLVLTYW